MIIKLEGDKEIQNTFRAMSVFFQDKVLQDAHVASLKYTMDRAKALAPKDEGDLVNSIGVVRAKGQMRTELGLVFGGPRRGGKNKGYHAHLVEFGTKSRKTKSGANRGVMPKKPFMEPAWEQTSGKVMNSINENLGKKLNNLVRRTLRK